MIKKPKNGFTLTELLVVIAIIALLIGIVLVWLGGARAQTRDAKRKAEVDSIRAAVEMHYPEQHKYPIKEEWCKLEEDGEGNPCFTGDPTPGSFQQATAVYLPQVPKDPLYGKTKDTGDPFSYQYKTNSEGTEYKIHVELETGGFYEWSSVGGGEIVYGGGGGGGGGGVIGPPAGLALQFDGVDDYVEVSDSDSLDITEEITIEAWIKANSVTPRPDWSPVVVKKCGYAECYGILVTEDQTYLYFFVQTGGVSFASANIPTGEWLHVVGSWDRTSPNNIDLYFNGVKLGEGPVGTGALSVSNLPALIGGATASYGDGTSYCPYYFDGIIDEVRIYAKRLPESLIAAHYQGDFSGDSTGCNGGDCDLRTLWHFDEGFGTTTADSSGNGNNGVLINNPQWVSVP